MSAFSRFISATKVNITLFIVAAILLLVSVVGGTQAALTYYSDTYLARLNTSQIGVTLLENGNEVAWRDYAGDDRWNTASTPEDTRLLQSVVPAGEQLQIGRSYSEEIQALNSGQITQYVRVKLYKYWEDGDGQKVYTVTPDLIKIDLAQNSGWEVDEDDTTDERIVAYYTLPLASGEMTPSLTRSFSIDPSVTRIATEEKTTEGNTTTYVAKYDYKGLRFCVEAEVDAIQEHNIERGALSAWGKNLTETNGRLVIG